MIPTAKNRYTFFSVSICPLSIPDDNQMAIINQPDFLNRRINHHVKRGKQRRGGFKPADER